MSAENADAPPHWPITIRATWVDPGYSPREWSWVVVVATSLGWIGLVGVVTGDRSLAKVLYLAVAIAAWLLWKRLRSRSTEVVLTLAPDRLRLQEGRGSPPLELLRASTGWLFAGETGLDWEERAITLTDDKGRIVARLRTRTTRTEVLEPGEAREWWDRQLAAGTQSTSIRPPEAIPVVALLGAWWPNPGQRLSVRGSLGGRAPWKEASLHSYPSWNRRQMRFNGAVTGLAIVVIGVLAGWSTWPWSTAELVAVTPPGIVGLAASIRALASR